MVAMKTSSPSAHLSVRSMVSGECANYVSRQNGVVDYCLCEPSNTAMHCVFFAQAGGVERCGYFERCVLPADPSLEALYYDSLKAPEQRDVVLIECRRCHAKVPRITPRQKHCEECKAEVARTGDSRRHRRYDGKST